MPKSPPTFRPHGLSPAARAQAYERERGSSTARLYDGRWSKAAKATLAEHPLCQYCELEDLVEPSTLVDHFWPHRGDPVLFWDRRFWIPSCASCHSGMKQSIERGGTKALLKLAARLNLPPRG